MSQPDDEELNVDDEPLTPCSLDPETGYRRDGYCRDVLEDSGRHQMCAVMTAEFLVYSAEQGNDLRTARPALNFPGLEPGDRWCVCLPRWLEAYEDGEAPPVIPEATSKSVLTHVPRETLAEYAYEDDLDEAVDGASSDTADETASDADSGAADE